MNQLFWILQLVAWAFLILFTLRLNLILKYPLVYAYIFLAMAFEIAMPLIAEEVGVNTLTYTYLYFFAAMSTFALACAVILKIMSTLQPITLRKDWHLGAGAAAIVLLGLTEPNPVWVLFRLIDIAYTILTFVGAMTVVRMIRRRKDLALGWNLQMVLLALTIPACFHSLVVVAFTIDSSISYQSLTYWTRATAVASWIILAVGMSEHSPPRRLVGGVPVRASRGGELAEGETGGNLPVEKSGVSLVEVPVGLGCRGGAEAGLAEDGRGALRPRFR